MEFKELSISKEIMKSIEKMGFEEATPIQSQTIPLISEGKDIIAQSPTGTGKTFAFGIPVIDRLDSTKQNIQVLILCPTRELVLQTTEELQTLSEFKHHIGIVPIYGGQQIERQMMALRKHPEIIVATPGRLMDHLRRRTVDISQLTTVVLDEADEMLDMGFREDIDSILETVPAGKQMVLFSATLSQEIMQIANTYQHDAVLVKINHKELTIPTIEQYYVEARGKAKIDAMTLLIEHNRYKLCLVFCNTKRMVDELTQDLLTRGYSVEALHGDMRQMQRDKVMKRFRQGEVDILVATDVAARGIDVDDIEVVFNYDIPSDEEYYVHRIGRTGRAYKKGVAYTFAAGKEIYKLRDIMHYTKSVIHPMKMPTLSDVKEQKVGTLLQSIRQIVKTENLSMYVNQLENIINGDEQEPLTTLDIAAALLKMVMKESEAKLSQTEEVPQYTERLHMPSEGFRNKRRGSRLFMTLGKMDRITPRDMLEIISKNSGIDKGLVGDMDIRDKFSFVDVPREYVKQVTTALNGIKIKGRTIVVEEVNNKR